jgi:hypothetical protein
MHKLTVERICLTHTRFVDAQTHAFAALADMPIKHRNVLLPALTPVLQDAIALATQLRRTNDLKNTEAKTKDLEKIAEDLRRTIYALLHGFEMALRLKALPPGRVALVVENSIKALP